MLVVDGPAKSVGQLIASLYNDAAIPRNAWNVSHTERSRKTHALRLAERGEESVRQGVGVRTESLAAVVESRARKLGLGCARLSGKSRGAM